MACSRIAICDHSRHYERHDMRALYGISVIIFSIIITSIIASLLIVVFSIVNLNIIAPILIVVVDETRESARPRRNTHFPRTTSSSSVAQAVSLQLQYL